MLSGLSVAQRILTGYVRPQNWIGYLIFHGRGKLPAAVYNFFILVLKRKRGLSQDHHGVVPKLPHRLPSRSLEPPLLLAGPRGHCPSLGLCLEHTLCMVAQRCPTISLPGKSCWQAYLTGSNLSANPQARWKGGPLIVPNSASFNLPFPTYITY